MVTWAWLLVNLCGLIYAVRSLLRRQRAEAGRQALARREDVAAAAVRNEVLRIISVYRLRKGRLLIGVLALNAFVGVVAIVIEPPDWLIAGAMLASGAMLAGVCFLIDAMDLAVERYLAEHAAREAAA